MHLAGANVGERWTPEHKREILVSREQGTGTIVKAMLGMAVPPEVFISASAVGYYGAVQEGEVSESSKKGTDFLAGLCAQWEEEASAAARA